MLLECANKNHAKLLPLKRDPLPPATQQVIETLEAELAKLRSGKVQADAVILIIIDGEDSDIVYANLSPIEAVGTLHTTATSIIMERQS
jgi:hypothetical protein